jgi:hypothetical protein
MTEKQQGKLYKNIEHLKINIDDWDFIEEHK